MVVTDWAGAPLRQWGALRRRVAAVRASGHTHYCGCGAHCVPRTLVLLRLHKPQLVLLQTLLRVQEDHAAVLRRSTDGTAAALTRAVTGQVDRWTCHGGPTVGMTTSALLCPRGSLAVLYCKRTVPVDVGTAVRRIRLKIEHFTTPHMSGFHTPPAA